ncbi:LADA_0F10462g1_1 [Lachancea dasiensis]|uniref:Topoisomerase I damage affected protein 2 n=1 Tax=Lachancea dasiensis TaxID=1072105 RepID=A0A1G4JLQ2_9SACH|nr:LADA_0F10462g1_1 [Lachancea dasiensis]
MTSVQVTSTPSSDEFPVAPEKLIAITETSLKDTSNDPEAGTASILAELGKASSVHKFVVSVTRVDASRGSDFDLDIDSHVGGSWNKAKDGMFSHSIESSAGVHYLVTVVWISI